MNIWNRIRIAGVVLSLLGPAEVLAASCSSPPACTGRCPNPSWWSSYKSWCSACGGTSYQDSSGGGCRPGPNWGGSSSSSTAPSTGNALDDAYGRAMGAAQNSNQMMQASGMYLGAKILEEAMKGPTPEQQAAAAAQRQYEAEQRAIEAENRKNRLLSEMQDIDGGEGELQLLSGDDDGGSGGLALMDDDGNTRGIRAKPKAPKTKRNPPPAVRKNPGPYTPGAKPDAGNGQLAMNFGDEEPPRARERDAGPPQAPEPESFARGVLDGDACNQRNAGALCGGLAGEAINRCLANYNRGFDQGARQNEQRLTARGTEMGRRDRGGPNAAMSYNDSRGSCGNIFVRAYNIAHR